MTPQQNSQSLAALVAEVARLTAEQAPYYDIFPVKQAASEALWRHTEEIEQRLAERVQADPKIRALLVDLYLCSHLSSDRDLHPRGLFGRVNWQAVLEKFFLTPTDDQIEAREPGFRAEHGIPKVVQS